jgi:hypothetical protein
MTFHYLRQEKEKLVEPRHRSIGANKRTITLFQMDCRTDGHEGLKTRMINLLTVDINGTKSKSKIACAWTGYLKNRLRMLVAFRSGMLKIKL